MTTAVPLPSARQLPFFVKLALAEAVYGPAARAAEPMFDTQVGLGLAKLEDELVEYLKHLRRVRAAQYIHGKKTTGTAFKPDQIPPGLSHLRGLTLDQLREKAAGR